MKKIAIIHTGGTFGMVPTQPADILAPGDLQSQIHDFLPEIERLADIEVFVPFNLDSSDIGIPEWDQLSSMIDRGMSVYDGFVLIHGTDTMVYTAAALSFSLRNLQKPIVLTGSQRPLSKLRSDARSNLIDAVELATMDIPEVLIVFGQKILRGNRSKKISITNYIAFDSPNFPVLGEIGLNIQLNHKLVLNPVDNYFFMKGFTPEVVVVSIYPSLSPDYFYSLLRNPKIKIIILRGFGSGHLPHITLDWLRFVKDAFDKDKIVFIGSHSTHGSVDLNLYESGKKARELGAVGLDGLTIEAAYVKLLKILSLTTNSDDIREQLMLNWSGEV
jgi:L-asparaginase